MERFRSCGFRYFATKRRGRSGILVLDPVMAWGATAPMGTKQLLDAVDRASRAGRKVSGHEDLWERLSCRCQALMLALSVQELSRALFGFYRASYTDKELLATAGEALLSEKIYDEEATETILEAHKLGKHAPMSANDVAMLLKAFSKHGYKDLKVIDHLLQRVTEILETAVVTDVSQLLAAIVRLQLGNRLAGGANEAPHPGLLNHLFRQARWGLFDKFTPASDVTNLCVAAAKLPPTEQGEALLLDVAKDLAAKADRASNLAPGDLLRRLQSFVAYQDFSELPLPRSLYEHAAKGLGQRCMELDSTALVPALQERTCRAFGTIYIYVDYI